MLYLIYGFDLSLPYHEFYDIKQLNTLVYPVYLHYCFKQTEDGSIQGIQGIQVYSLLNIICMGFL